MLVQEYNGFLETKIHDIRNVIFYTEASEKNIATNFEFKQ